MSGDIYEKIEIAERYGFDNNIEALKSVLPEPLSAEDIHVQLGAQWVPIDYIREFSSHIFKESGYDYSRMRIDYDEYSAKYYTTQPNRWNINSEVTLNWGVQKTDNVDFWKSQPDYNGYDLLQILSIPECLRSETTGRRKMMTEKYIEKVKSILKEQLRLDSLQKTWNRSLRIGFIRTMNEKKIW